MRDLNTKVTAAALVVGLALAAGLTAPAEATSLARLSTEQLTDASDAIVRGTVTEVWTEYTADHVWTYAQVEVSEVLKGDPGLDLLVISQPGGRWAHRGTTVEGVARFSVGEDAYFFVENLPSQGVDGGRWMPVGMFQGKYTVQLDPYTRQDIVHRFAVDARQDYDHRFLPLPSAESRVSAADFEAHIRARVAAGWDGQPIPGVSADKLRRINRLQEGVE